LTEIYSQWQYVTESNDAIFVTLNSVMNVAWQSDYTEEEEEETSMQRQHAKQPVPALQVSLLLALTQIWSQRHGAVRISWPLHSCTTDVQLLTKHSVFVVTLHDFL